MSSDTTKTQDSIAAQRPRHDRLLRTARELLRDAEHDADVLAHCEAVLSPPSRGRTRAQASLDATNALLALSQAGVDSRRIREARQLLVEVSA